MSAAKARVRVEAERREWSVRNMRKAGIVSIQVVSGLQEAAEEIAKEGNVVLDQQGKVYLIATMEGSN